MDMCKDFHKHYLDDWKKKIYTFIMIYFSNIFLLFAGERVCIFVRIKKICMTNNKIYLTPWRLFYA